LSRALATTLLAITATLLLTPSLAPGEPAGSTILISRPGGFGALPPGIVDTSSIGFNAVSDNGCRTAFRSSADGLASPDDDRVVNIYVRDDCTNTLFLASRATGASGTAANGNSSDARISGDGTRVAFRSNATNLDGADSDTSADIYVRNLSADTTTLVSRATGAGGAKQNGTCNDPTLDDGGTKIAFSCSGTNLDPADVDADTDIFLRDTAGNTTTLISRADTASGVAANNATRRPAISGDGLRIAFETLQATNLVAADNDTTDDIVVRDLPSNTNILVSRADGAAGTKSTSTSIFPDLNQDGTKVVFSSFGLGDGQQVWLRNTATDTTVLISRATTAGGAVSDASATNPSIDDAGDTVAFDTAATNLSLDDTNAGQTDVYVRDGTTTTLASTSFGEVGAGSSGSPALNGLGTIVSFSSDADNLTDQDANDFTNILRRTLSASVPNLVSRPTGTGAFGGDGTAVSTITCCSSLASADGRFVAFTSQSDTLSADDDNRFNNTFVRDTRTGATTLVSRASGANGAAATGSSSAASISDDGRRVAFEVSADKLIPGPDVNGGQSDLFVRDLVTNETELVNRASGADGAQGTAGVFVASLDADGSRIAFSTLSGNLVPSGGSGVYVRDLDTDETILASRENGPGGAIVSFGDAEIDLSGDGNVVSFTTDDVDLGADGSIDQAYVRDLAAGATELVSRASGAAGAIGNQISSSPVLDFDGSRVAFETSANNLVGDDPDTNGDIVVRDRDSDQTILVSRADGVAGVKADDGSRGPTLSADGTRVLFIGFATNLVSGVTGQQAYLRDLAAATTTLAVRADGPSGAPGDAITARLTAGGSCVVFDSLKTGLTPSYSGSLRQVYLRAVDRECPDVTAPDTTIASGPSGSSTDTVATFAFTATETGATFECRLDAAAFAACTSPFTSGALGTGAHTFDVRASDVFGNTDASPASRTFTVTAAAPTATPTPSPTATPTPTLAAGRLTYAGATALRTDSKGAVKLRVRCASGTRGCRGTLRLRAKLRSGGRTRTLVVASRSFTVSSGRTVTLSVRLSAAARSTLRRAKRLKATLELVSTGVSGKRTTTLTLRPPVRRG